MKKLFLRELKVPLDKYRGFDIKYILPWKDEILGEAPETEKEYNE